MRWLAILISLTNVLGCVTRKGTVPATDFLSESLAHPVKIDANVVPSRYWAHGNFLVHFISNVNEQNRKDVPVIYVHGLSSNLEIYSDLIKLNHSFKGGRPFYALDIPPFGKSAIQATEISIQDTTEMFQEFIAMTDAPQVDLICHSLGGQICMHFALMKPERIHLLTLISPAGIYDKSAFVNHATSHYSGINIGNISHPNAKTIGDMTWYDQNFHRRMITDNPIALIALESFRESLRNRIQNLKVKTLILWGSEDQVFSYENGLYLKENVENSTLYILDGAGHTPMKTHAPQISKLLKKYL